MSYAMLMFEAQLCCETPKGGNYGERNGGVQVTRDMCIWAFGLLSARDCHMHMLLPLSAFAPSATRTASMFSFKRLPLASRDK